MWYKSELSHINAQEVERRAARAKQRPNPQAELDPASLALMKAIKPGVNYPSSVRVEEPGQQPLTLLLQSYYVGMYCAIHVGDSCLPVQTWDIDNKTFVAALKRALNKALVRGATLEIGALRPCKLTP